MGNITWKFPKQVTTTVIIGDSQCKHLYNHFDPRRKGAPAFISKAGAKIEDISSLMDFVPQTATTVVLHVGTNDLTTTSAPVAFSNYEDLLGTIRRDHPNIRRVYVTLVLPRAPNRRRHNFNWRFVERFNRQASRFNGLLRGLCQRTRDLFYFNHGLECFPLWRVLAADGLHPSFEGVAIMASHIHDLVRKNYVREPELWLTHFTAAPTNQSAPTSPTQPPAPPAQQPASPPNVGARASNYNLRQRRTDNQQGGPSN